MNAEELLLANQALLQAQRRVAALTDIAAGDQPSGAALKIPASPVVTLPPTISYAHH